MSHYPASEIKDRHASIVDAYRNPGECWVDCHKRLEAFWQYRKLAGHYRNFCAEIGARGDHLGYPTISPRPDLQAWYVCQRLDGQSHALAEMLVLQSPPMSNTDREFLEGHCNGNQFDGDEYTGDYYKAVAERRGVDITGKVYVSGLAAYPGDPQAWVSGRGDAERVLDSRGWGSEGSVSRKLTNVGEPMNQAVAPDIVQEAALEHVERAGIDQMKVGEFQELKQSCAAALKPHWAD